jgi:hypothetical protein
MYASPAWTRRRRWALAGLALVFHLSFVAFLAGNTIENNLLDPDFYNSALADTDAYNRIYTQVLADPQLESFTADLLGGTTLGDQRSVAIATLRLVLPPATLREITESTIAALIAYLRGESRRIDGQYDLTQTLANFDSAIGQEVKQLLSTARVDHPQTIDAFRDVLAQFSTALQNGTIPASLPALPDEESADALVDYLFGPQGLLANRKVANQAKAALTAGDTNGALLVMAGALVQQPSSAASGRIERRLSQGTSFDPLSALSQAAGRPEVDILAKFNMIRDAATVLSGPVRWANIVLMVASLGAYVVLAQRRRALRWRAAGQLMFSAGLGCSLLWLIAGRVFQTPITDALSANGLGTPPPAIATLVGDIDASLASQMTRTLLTATGLFALAGLLIIATSYAPLPVLRTTWQRRPPLRRVGRVAAMIGLVAAVAFSVWVYSGGLERGPRECNGSHDLCRKRVNEVTFAATHNSMSSANAGWLFPDQDAGIRQQLESGIRGLLIDTHYWDTRDDVVALTRDRVPDNLSVALSSFVTSIGEPQPGALLCHSLCTLGNEPLTDGLTEVKRFLDRNRNEVIVVVIEDYVSVADTEAAFKQTGLDRYVVTHRPDTSWPTLGQLVRTNKRLIVFSENQKPPPAWYGSFEASFQDTPYNVDTPDAFTCTLNRGDPTNPLLLLNNWIDKVSPDRADAATVNSYDALMANVSRCLQRGRRPNLIAVDFYNIGNVIQVAADLNRR